VRDLALYGAACEAYLGMRASSAVYHDPIQKVRVQFWSDANGQTLELVEPAGADSPVQEALRKGGGLNHLCFEVDDLEATLDRFRRAGLEIAGAAGRPGAEGSRIAFIHPRSTGGVLIELREAGGGDREGTR